MGVDDPKGGDLDQSNTVVRNQLAGTISRKQARIRALSRQEEQLRREAVIVQRKIEALQAEVAAIETTLQDLGGRIEQETNG